MGFADLPAFLMWVSVGGGAMVLSGYVMSYVLENWPTWHTLPLWLKTLAPILLSALFAVAAQSLLALDIPAAIPPIVSAVLLTMVNWLASQRAYVGIKDTTYSSRAHAKAYENDLIIEDDGTPIE